MSQQSPPPPPPPPSPGRSPRGSGLGGRDSLPRWTIWVLGGVVLAFLFLGPSLMTSTDRDEIDYSEMLTRVQQDEVSEITWNNNDGSITGKLDDGTEFSTNGPLEPAEDDRALFREHDVKLEFTSPQGSWIEALLPLLIPVALFVGIFWLMQRRAQSQMGGIMSIGRSRAKTYSTERPGTTFADVAGYDGVKQEITEVVDFLKHPERFAEIGARIPKGVLLVGPPGTGKTLIARAVAGEAGVPFLSVTGSDFMEMFVGVGASRVRDLFQNARKLGRAIIFVDEVDSIGRKRGAGLGGGHDEREQTLNQMLSEMDGFEATEGIVMIGATNRPDILDPALLRPGRFDRQVVVPLPELEERKAILAVHCKSKRLAPDVELDVVARGTPGMSGADLANLVNEAALFAVRSGSDVIRRKDFEEARDRVLMDERHIYRQDYIEDSLVVRMGGRIAEELVFGVISTGANNDLVGSTELARKMVSEWGMSQRVGPMAWGSQGQVFLGEDLMHTREYSDETARVIDEEVERILREGEERCRHVLRANRHGLDLVARALLEHETIDGAEVTRLIDLAADGSSGPVSGPGSTPAYPAALGSPGGPNPPTRPHRYGLRPSGAQFPFSGRCATMPGWTGSCSSSSSPPWPSPSPWWRSAA